MNAPALSGELRVEETRDETQKRYVRTATLLDRHVHRGAIWLVFPATVWFAIFGAIVSTGLWLYVSLRDADASRGYGPPN